MAWQPLIYDLGSWYIFRIIDNSCRLSLSPSPAQTAVNPRINRPADLILSRSPSVPWNAWSVGMPLAARNTSTAFVQKSLILMRNWRMKLASYKHADCLARAALGTLYGYSTTHLGQSTTYLRITTSIWKTLCRLYFTKSWMQIYGVCKKHV